MSRLSAAQNDRGQSREGAWRLQWVSVQSRGATAGQSHAKVRGTLTEDGHPGEELLVHLALADGGAHEDAAVRVPVDTPQLDVRLGAHRGRAGSAVDERQLAERAALADRRHDLVVDVHLRQAKGKAVAVSLVLEARDGQARPSYPPPPRPGR